MKTAKQPFLALIFPVEKDKTSLGALFTRFNKELTIACGQQPTIVWPDVTAICLLVEGEEARISHALRTAAAIDTRYLLVNVDTPFVERGLSSAPTWLQARLDC